MSEKIVCLGIGGGALFYIAKYVQLLGKKMIGYDIKGNERTTELALLENIKIILENPAKPFEKDTNLIIYTAAFPDEVIKQVKMQNPKIEMMEAGTFVSKLAERFEKNDLSIIEKRAFRMSKIAPLYSIDYTKQKFIGVTGTDGKTTTCFMIYHILQKLGYKPGMISTVEARVGGKGLDTGLHTTTPSAQKLFEIIEMMQREKCTHIILECTSHGLAMGRLAGVKLDVGVYTNIKGEHLDYHKTWESYAKAKSLLITRRLKPAGTAVLNKDDNKAFDLLKNLSKNTIFYTTRNGRVKENPEGLEFKLGNKMYKLPVLGKYNVENALAAITTCKALGLNKARVAKALETFQTVNGRMDVLQKEPFYIIVDFAHTPNALNAVLQSAQKLKKTGESKIILVFGCAGKRDFSKRFPMGKLARKYTDITILTAEDPRSESLKSINDEIEQGWNSVNIAKSSHQLIRFDETVEKENVRREAIKRALSLAKDGDVVLVTGKGHELSLCFGEEERPWNDIKEVNKILKVKE
ncbi:MAG: UDP-N-acetylmuramoyl-L-alanyl-D-glutamate--2,6-diaminopimelate ligase [Patescibacteria group bacterium]